MSCAYLDLGLLAGLRADRLDEVTVVTPDLRVVHLQASLIPASHVDVSILLLAYVLEVHDFIPAGHAYCGHETAHALISYSSLPSPS